MITIKLIGIFIVGLAFTILGFSICKFYKWKSRKVYLLLLLGFIIMYTPTFGPLSKSFQQIEEIQNIENKKVKSIILRQIGNKTSEKIITNRTMIAKICNSLRNSESTDDSFMKKNENNYFMQINMTNNVVKKLELKLSDEITCISINSNGIFSWNFGKLKSNDLQNIIK